MTDIVEGARLDHYELKEMLARSGMASIFRAIDTQTGAAVVLKIPHLHFEGDVVFSERFRREEAIGQRLDHPNLVKVLPTGKRSRVYLALELIEGKSLRAIMASERRLPTERALDLARQIAEALVYLHAHGVVHRDLKPENILITEQGVVKILDFGIALDESARRMTWFGLSSAVGTPDYMAPEQAQSRRGDVRTDIYALGTILYEMLTGEVPFVGSNAQTILRAKLHENPRPPSQIVPDLDPKLEEIVLHAIERRPRDRYERAADMLEDLRDPSRVVLRDRSAAASQPRGPLAALRRRWFPLAMTMIVLCLLALMWITHRYTTEPSQQDAPAESLRR